MKLHCGIIAIHGIKHISAVHQRCAGQRLVRSVQTIGTVGVQTAKEYEREGCVGPGMTAYNIHQRFVPGFRDEHPCFKIRILILFDQAVIRAESNQGMVSFLIFDLLADLSFFLF